MTLRREGCKEKVCTMGQPLSHNFKTIHVD
jgi:hypothetical protein